MARTHSTASIGGSMSPQEQRRRTAQPVTKKILRMSELTGVVGLSRAWIYKLVHQGEFPRPIKLGPRSIGFLVSEVDGWLEARTAERDNGQTAA